MAAPAALRHPTAREDFRVRLYNWFRSAAEVDGWANLEGVVGLRPLRPTPAGRGPPCSVYTVATGTFCTTPACPNHVYCARHLHELYCGDPTKAPHCDHVIPWAPNPPRTVQKRPPTLRVSPRVKRERT